MGTLNVVTVVGVRPQFVKAAAVSRAIAAFNATGKQVRLRERTVHTGAMLVGLEGVLLEETEWTEFVEAGCNRVVGTHPETILAALAAFEAAGAGLPADRPVDLFGDGHSAEKIVTRLIETQGAAVSRRAKA